MTYDSFFDVVTRGIECICVDAAAAAAFDLNVDVGDFYRCMHACAHQLWLRVICFCVCNKR